jgi:hypothetical protein
MVNVTTRWKNVKDVALSTALYVSVVIAGKFQLGANEFGYF